MTQENSPPSTVTKLLRIVVGIAALAAVVVFGKQLGGYVPQFAAWVEGLGAWGPIVFAIGYVIATVAFIPGSLLTLASGAIFGLGKGTVVVFLGATTGACAAFLIARYLARSAIERRLENRPKFQVIDRAVAKEGLKIVSLLRLSPVLPFNLLNYGLGLTKVRFIDYLISSLAMLPGTFLYVYFGKTLGTVAAVASGAETPKGAGSTALLVVGLVATVAVTTFVTRIAKRALDQEVGEEQPAHE